MEAGDVLVWEVLGVGSGESLDGAVASVGSGGSAVHASLVASAAGRLLHALPRRGVVGEPLGDALAAFRSDHPHFRLRLLRLREGAGGEARASLGAAAVAWAEGRLGAAYNDVFASECRDSEGREAYYCSQLLRLAFPRRLLPAKPLVFHDANGNDLPFWEEYFAKRARPVPSDDEGCHPADLLTNPHLEEVYLPQEYLT